MVLSSNPGNQVVHSQPTWPMSVADSFLGWSLAQDRSGSPVVRTGPMQGAEEKADSHMVMPVQFCRGTKQQVEGAVRFAQRYCYLP